MGFGGLGLRELHGLGKGSPGSDGPPLPSAAEASQQVAQLSEELARRAEDTARQQEEISQLLVQVVDLQHKCRAVSARVPPARAVGGTRTGSRSLSARSCPQYGAEVEELQQHLAAAKEVQQQLRMEVSLDGGVLGPALVPPGPCLSCACARSSGTCRRSTRSAGGCCRRRRRR